MEPYTKDPNAVLDYAFDWITHWLGVSETITSHVVTTESGITKESDSESAGIVTVWLSEGEHGKDYTVACKITTNEGRTDERSINIKCRER